MNKVIKMLVVTLAFLLVLAGCSGIQISNHLITKIRKQLQLNMQWVQLKLKGNQSVLLQLYQGATDVAVSLGVKPVGAVESWTQNRNSNT